MRIYAMQARDRGLIDHATEIHLQAERRAGELLKDMAQAGERAVRKNMKSQPATSKLSDLNINKSQSSRWQKLADVSTDDFEELVTKAQQKTCAVVDRAQQPKPKPKPPKPKSTVTHNSGRSWTVSTRAREGECELGTLATDNIVRHSRRAEITTLHEVLWMRPRVPPTPPR